MTHQTVCPACDTPIPADSPSGVCPNCVLGLGISDAQPMANADNIENVKTEGVGVGRAGQAGKLEPNGQHGNSADAVARRISEAEAKSMQSVAASFPQLEVLEKLGQGGMGAVYKVRQISLDRIVALKVLPPALEDDPSFSERFQREARALARLSHPNIVMIFEFGVAGSYHYFLMEYVDGVNLRQAIATGGLAPAEALQVVPQICEALQFAHDEGIVHRDVKPENVLLDQRGRVKIADFGLAKILRQSPEDFTLTATNQLVGTPRYMAPEQIENPLQVDHRSDIYSLGVVFYEMLTGELPLGRFEAPSKRNDAVQGVDEIVMRTLEKEPDRRYQQASEVRTAVQQATYQPGYDARPFPTPSAVKLPTVPVDLFHPFRGFVTVRGLLKVDEAARQIFLDLHVKDIVGGLFKSEFKQVHVGLDHLISIHHKKNWLEPNFITLQTDAIRELADLPGAERGRIRLVVDRSDDEQCTHVVERIKTLIGTSDNPIQEKPAAGRAENRGGTIEEAADRYEHVKRKLFFTSIGLGVAILIDILCAIFVLGLLMDPFDDDLIPLFIIAFVGPIIFIPIMACTIRESLKMRSLGFAKKLAIASMLPIHPGSLFSIPFGAILILHINKYRDEGLAIRRAQAEVANYAQRTDAFTRYQPHEQMGNAIQKYQFPIVGTVVMIAGVFSALMMLVFSGIGMTMLLDNHRAWTEPFMIALIFAIGTSSIFIGWNLIRGVRREMLSIWAIVLMLPLTFICVVTIPVGIYLLIECLREKQENFFLNPYG